MGAFFLGLLCGVVLTCAVFWVIRQETIDHG